MPQKWNLRDIYALAYQQARIDKRENTERQHHIGGNHPVTIAMNDAKRSLDARSQAIQAEYDAFERGYSLRLEFPDRKYHGRNTA